MNTKNKISIRFEDNISNKKEMKLLNLCEEIMRSLHKNVYMVDKTFLVDKIQSFFEDEKFSTIFNDITKADFTDNYKLIFYQLK